MTTTPPDGPQGPPDHPAVTKTIVLTAYHTEIRVPTDHLTGWTDDQVTELADKINLAFESATGALTTLLAEVDPQLTLTTEEA